MSLRPAPRFMILLALLVFGGAPAPAAASSTIPMNSVDLQIRADLIVAGQVTAVKSRWVGRGLIVTDVQVEVSQKVKGEPGTSAITVRVPGGRVDDVIQAVDDAPVFEVGGQALLFLKHNTALDVYTVLGLSQGKIDLQRQPDGRLAMSRRLDGVTTQGLPRALSPGTSWQYLDEFLTGHEVDFE